jgi:hypothetical protein
LSSAGLRALAALEEVEAETGDRDDTDENDEHCVPPETLCRGPVPGI